MEHWTLLLDLYIIYKTILNIVVGEKECVLGDNGTICL